MAEWSKAPHSKCGVPVTVPRVRIPISPPNIIEIKELFLFSLCCSHNGSLIADPLCEGLNSIDGVAYGLIFEFTLAANA
jgi:hypothetical protein